jgi:ribonuclease HI
MKNDVVEMWCDGAAIGNPGPSGYGVLLKCGESRKELSGFIGHATNNIAEVEAAIAGLKALKWPCEVTVYSDSEYLVKIASGERTAHSNQEVWARLFDATRSHQVTWRWVKGHAGEFNNELVNRLANHAARRGK